MSGRKQGRFTKEEIAIIEQECESKTPPQLATMLNRDARSVKEFLKKRGLTAASGLKTAAEIKISYDLTTRPFWAEIQNQFRKPEERELFKYYWSKIIAQFRDDVQSTEEMQIVDAIRLEILMNRALTRKTNTEEGIDDYQRMVTEERQKGDDADPQLIISFERQIASMVAALDTLGKDYKELQTKKSALLKDLKATRDQRLDRLEDSKESFMGWLKRLDDDNDFAKMMGTEMEKMRMAVELERTRLTKYHTYEDGMIDQPFLTPESVLEDHI